MAKRDFYSVLGVSRSATQEEIRRAYRAKARQLHPDVNKAPDAQKKFTELQEAYSTLSDEQKRAVYDRYGHEGLEAGFAASKDGGAGGAGGGSRVRYEWSNGGSGFGGGVDPDEISEMFETFFGERAGGRSRTKKPGAGRRAAEPMRQELFVSFLTAATGGVEQIRLESSGKRRTIEVKVPAGITEGAQLRIPGSAATDGAEVIFTIRIGKHPIFRRPNPDEPGSARLDLVLDLPLTIVEATLGATVPAPTLGSPVELKVPPGTSTGQRLRIRGKGIRTEQGETGDLYAVVKIVAPNPEALNESDRAALRGLGERLASPRAEPGWPNSRG